MKEEDIEVLGEKGEMPESNFVSEADFEKLLNSLPIQSDNSKLTNEDWVWFYRIMFGCALRVKETTLLRPEHFNLKHRILIIEKPKTGKGKPQKTTILPRDAEEMKSYLESKHKGERIWHITRQTAWYRFKTLCQKSGLDYHWEKKVRSFDKGWPYLLRSSRSKIMKQMGATRELRMKKLRHEFRDVHDAYEESDIPALLAWEAEHYPLVIA